IASCSNMSSGYFCSFFRKVMNVSPFEYLGMVRIKAACMMLKTSDRPVVDICMDCGFENLSSFNHSFRKMMGCSPSAYRRR
ncbi:MAG: helix-turn-helix transcriptional regulator, partial [Sphaerochaetaceae bacterium]|nr:helix-turn-helix transcriptional regulator [Sphaerochaetaceae bacterium]